MGPMGPFIPTIFFSLFPPTKRLINPFSLQKLSNLFFFFSLSLHLLFSTKYGVKILLVYGTCVYAILEHVLLPRLHSPSQSKPAVSAVN